MQGAAELTKQFVGDTALVVVEEASAAGVIVSFSSPHFSN